MAAPTPVNSVTVTRYHVAFKRSDGRNTPGVDVPYAFDGAATGTIGADGGCSPSRSSARRPSWRRR
ncbi:MAG: hypothetical protein MZU95_03085 [Desulfomicrobium escambiense]|nr:hypothetical protein [Desulfomicrobium escambiense]